MPTKNPRIALTLPQHRYDLLRRMAVLQGVSMASLVSELLDEFYPVLERLCVVLEASQKAQETSIEGVRKAVGMAEAELAPLMKAVTGQFDLFFDRITDVVVGGEGGTCEAGAPSLPATTSGASAAALNPRVVTRGSGSQQHNPRTHVKPSTGKALKRKSGGRAVK